MKRFVTTAMAMSVLFTACSSTAFSIVKPEVTYAVSLSNSIPEVGSPFVGMLSPEEYRAAQEAKEAERIAAERDHKARLEAIRNTNKMAKVIKRLKTTEGSTPYVRSGASPSGWDCSGLVRWTYQQMGIELHHGATAQYRSGTIVNDPLPGDIVAYVYGQSRYSGHVGIYIGDGKVIHSLKPGTRTRVESSEQGVMNHGGIRTVYVRIIPMIPESEMPEKRLSINRLGSIPGAE
jgi:cell wall-associated NlpC family hydrolase